MNFNYFDVYVVCYEGEGTETQTQTELATKTEEQKTEENRTFTQDQVNKMLAEDRRKHQERIDKQVKELEQIKKSKGLTEGEKNALATQIEELKASVLTKEQLAAQEKKKLQDEAKAEREKLTGERDFYKNLYTQSTITRSIMDEAVSAEAFRPQQLVALLQGSTRLTEVTDAEGNPVPGEYLPKVKINANDKEGKPVTLDLTVPEAVKWMRDSSDYANLFKSNLTGGLGASASTGSKKIDPVKMTPQQYREYRAERDGRKSK